MCKFSVLSSVLNNYGTRHEEQKYCTILVALKNSKFYNILTATKGFIHRLIRNILYTVGGKGE
jgi:hypothetical protein